MVHVSTQAGLRVVVLAGGDSPERPVSLASGEQGMVVLVAIVSYVQNFCGCGLSCVILRFTFVTIRPPRRCLHLPVS